MCLSIPAKLVAIMGEDPLTRTGKVSFGGIIKEVSLAYVSEARIGDYVLTHVGFGISIIDEQEARFIYDFLKENGDDPQVRG